MSEEISWNYLKDTWSNYSGLEKTSLIAAGVFALLRTVQLFSYFRNNASSDIPTDPLIHNAREKATVLDNNLKSFTGTDPSNGRPDLWEPLISEALKTIEKHRHELFAPGKVTLIHSALEDVKSFRIRELEDAAMNTLYQTWQLTRLTLQQVLEGEKAWEEESAVYLTLHGCLQNMFASVPEEQVPFTTDCGDETLTMDADFWSNGLMTELKKSMPEEILPRDLTLDEVRQRIQQLRDLTKTLNQVNTETVDSFRSSQQRRDLCEAVYAFFEDRGWYLDETAENGFEEGDPRRGAALHLLSAAGDEAAFTFSGADNIEANIRFRDVHNRSMIEYLTQYLRQLLQDNGFTIKQLTNNV